MPTWGEILNEATAMTMSGVPNAVDLVRLNYVKRLSEMAGRDVIYYASKWTSGEANPQLVSIVDEDLQGFMEAIHGLKNKKLDLIIHTGGGSAEATEAIVSYLRQKFENIRVIVPQAAMSAGTMFACAGDEIVMGKHSFLGPIDPQFIMPAQSGFQMVPAHSILEQFKKAQAEIKADPGLLSAWIPILSQYGPALLVRCINQIDYGRELIRNWLNMYMFRGEDGSKATKIAEFLSDHGNFKTHSKHLSNEEAKKLGLKIVDLEKDQTFQEAVLSVYHSIMISFNGTAVKIIGSQTGNLFVKQQQQQVIQLPMPQIARPLIPPVANPSG